MGIFGNIFGDESSKFIKNTEKIVQKINALESDISQLKDEDFPKKTEDFRNRLQKGETLDDILPEAFALVREAMKRADNKRLFDVQLVGGLALHSGKIAEMKTGEGKTFVAVLPAYLNALMDEGVHIVTVNDYLSRIGAVLMGQVYNFLGLSVGVINSNNVSYLYDSKHKEEDRERDQVGEFKIVYDFLKPCARKEAYATEITYGTNHEYGFDYLRDNLVTTLSEMVQRGHSFAIVDEADSILIDEARTPLIISSASGDSEDFYIKFYQIAKQLKRDADYEVDEKLKAITLTDEGISKAEKLLGVSNIYTEKGIKFDVYGTVFNLNLAGEFNVQNCLAALAVSAMYGIDLPSAKPILEEIKSISGRMEFIQKEPFRVVVDYAHTPDSLESVYKTLKTQNPKNPKLICVLGAAGGGRDKWKRPEFGRIAEKYCDEIILTNEDSYDEIPEKIIEDIFSGISSSLKLESLKVHKVIDRKEAIKKALTDAQEGNTVIITGKGSEISMAVAGGKKLPWSDKQVVIEFLQERRG